MPGELLLINPRARRKSTKRRARNPVAKRVHHKVRRLAARTHHHRRRRNPISLKGEGVSTLLKGALVAGAGSVAVDAIMGQVRPMLPASIQTGYAYAATKGAATILLGILGRKALGPKAIAMAEGALTVQAANLITSFVPASMTLGGRQRILGPSAGMRGMGYFTSGTMLPGSPNLQLTTPKVLRSGMNGVGFFTRQGGSSGNAVRAREGVNVR